MKIRCSAWIQAAASCCQRPSGYSRRSEGASRCTPAFIRKRTQVRTEHRTRHIRSSYHCCSDPESSLFMCTHCSGALLWCRPMQRSKFIPGVACVDTCQCRPCSDGTTPQGGPPCTPRAACPHAVIARPLIARLIHPSSRYRTHLLLFHACCAACAHSDRSVSDLRSGRASMPPSVPPPPVDRRRAPPQSVPAVVRGGAADASAASRFVCSPSWTAVRPSG